MAEKTPLVAIKSHTYATRRLKAEDAYDARPRDARVLVAIGKARYATAEMKSAPIDDLAGLRAKYEAKLGKRPFMGWDAKTLSAKIVEAET